MITDEVMGTVKEAMVVAFQLGGPLLVVSIVVGLAIATLQTATQIHEQTLTFVPKLIVVTLLLLTPGAWVYRVMDEFVIRLFKIMASLQDGDMV